MKINDFKKLKSDYQVSKNLMLNECSEMAILIRENWIESVNSTDLIVQNEFKMFKKVDDVGYDDRTDCFSIALSNDKNVIIRGKQHNISSKYIYVKIDDIDENGLYAKAITRTFEKDLNDNITYLKDLISESKQDKKDLLDEIYDIEKAIKNYSKKLVNYEKIKQSYDKI